MTKARFDNLMLDLGQVDAWEVQYQPAETEVFLGVYGQSSFWIRSLLKKSTRHLLYGVGGSNSELGVSILPIQWGAKELLPTIWSKEV